MHRSGPWFLTEVRYRVKDTNSVNYADLELYAYHIEAIRQTLQRLATLWPEYLLRHNLATSESQNIVNGTARYPRPWQMLLPIAVGVYDQATTEHAEIFPIPRERLLDAAWTGYLLVDDFIEVRPAPTLNITNGLDIYYVKGVNDVDEDTPVVPLSQDFEDALLLYVVLVAKARQEETPSDFAPFYALIQRAKDAVALGTNWPKGDMGLRIPWRSAI